jgi:anti-sigma regulatory factor (Ser/Thr protein kinase)
MEAFEVMEMLDQVEAVLDRVNRPEASQSDLLIAVQEALRLIVEANEEYDEEEDDEEEDEDEVDVEEDEDDED